ncbi:hypothetical protein THRCLA_03691 [Thraustotheca clavata]|uniref:Leucine-rich repeat domain-containing protein n=1 Tax=Thraustotheca clavata TaxID=74557 RepID=A0A1W0A172_9STRA|nr:hypothetical protein THRCLA_03691 [Thraustotheca clavata]
MQPLNDNPVDDGPPPLFKLFSDGLSRIDRIADNSGFAFTALDVIEKELVGLEQIKDFRHVRFVNAAKNKLNDASPLTALEYLLVLNLSENQFTALPKLKNPHLKALDIGKNQLTSLLDGEATKLESLKVNGNQITSLEGIAAYKCLTTLDVSQNLITDMTIAAEIASLEHLIISENQLTTLNGLQLFPNLVSFKAELNQIAALSDVQILGSMLKLIEIDLTGNPLTQAENYRLDMILLMPKLIKLDGIVIEDEERIKAIALKQEREAVAIEEPSE